MEQQHEQFQQGVASAFENGSKMMGPALRANEIVIDSFSQLIKDQFAFGNACLNIGRKQAEAFTKASDPTELTSLLSDQGAAADYYNAAQTYGEALRENAEKTQERLLTVGREVTETVTDFAQNEMPQAPVVAAGKSEKASGKASAKTGKSE